MSIKKDINEISSEETWEEVRLTDEAQSPDIIGKIPYATPERYREILTVYVDSGIDIYYKSISISDEGNISTIDSYLNSKCDEEGVIDCTKMTDKDFKTFVNEMPNSYQMFFPYITSVQYHQYEAYRRVVPFEDSDYSLQEEYGDDDWMEEETRQFSSWEYFREAFKITDNVFKELFEEQEKKYSHLFAFIYNQDVHFLPANASNENVCQNIQKDTLNSIYRNQFKLRNFYRLQRTHNLLGFNSNEDIDVDIFYDNLYRFDNILDSEGLFFDYINQKMTENSEEQVCKLLDSLSEDYARTDLASVIDKSLIDADDSIALERKKKLWFYNTSAVLSLYNEKAVDKEKCDNIIKYCNESCMSFKIFEVSVQPLDLYMPKDKCEVIFERLKEKGYIDNKANKNVFLYYFAGVGDATVEKIQWKKTTTKLAVFTKVVYGDKTPEWKRVSNIFLDKKGKEFNAKYLKNTCYMRTEYRDTDKKKDEYLTEFENMLEP